ncbi:hypothetical protein F2Q70_00012970 [Brassica cretica]|uniref:Uncharacterized protein n=1 Tax=Brassica cretica TaxID=69181 RepID=A0A8S9M1I5_BRACR|nr:hypothetical protein F2Q70_00012970 [Brassica cretica]
MELVKDGAIRERARQMKAMCFVTVCCWRRHLKLGQTKIRVEGSMGAKNSRYKLIVNHGEAFGWQKKALIEARNEIHQKDKTIMGLKKTISKLQSDLAKNAEVEEDIINAFLKL